MKKLKILLSAFVLTFLYSGSLFAQTTINASAEVLADLTITEQQAINFGVVENDFTTDPVLDPSDATTSGDFADASGVAVGLVSVSGTGDQTVDITVDTDITLTESGSSDTITLTPSYNWTYDNLTSGGPTNPEISNTGADFSMTLDGTGQSDDGQNTILIGGTLTETSTPALTAGNYTGTGSITVSYQ